MGRVGIFGGTFDPVHQGHLILAEQSREQGQLDQVWFVPAPHPPHKDDRIITRFEQRVEMLALALAGNPAFQISEIEKERSGPSFTVDTVAELQHRHPEHVYYLLVGSDSLNDIHKWHEPLRLLQQAGLMVRERPGHPLPTAEVVRARLGCPADTPLRLEVIHTPLIEISSSDLRSRAAQGRSLRYFLPRAVETYIHEKRLYRS